jgi:antitoxin ParD1/3/4
MVCLFSEAMVQVKLTPKIDAWVKAQVEAGRYNDAGEVVDAAVRLLQREEALHEAKLAALRHEIDAAWRQADSGEFVDLDVEEINRELDAELTADGRG